MTDIDVSVANADSLPNIDSASFRAIDEQRLFDVTRARHRPRRSAE